MASAGEGNVLPPLGIDIAVGTPRLVDTEAAKAQLKRDLVAFPDKLTTENDAEQESPSDASGILTLSSAPSNVPHGPRGGSKARARKPKRVRTGCLTCRERHLKCDEALHQCHNCRKAGRICRRGVRLNFIDTQTAAPPHYIKPPLWNPVSIRDESRRIASEYVGGFERYPTPEKEIPLGGNLHSFAFFGEPVALNTTDQPVYGAVQSVGSLEMTFQGNSHATTPSNNYCQNSTLDLFRSASQKAINAVNHTCLQNPEETLLLQAFVEEVGPWMDSMNAVNYVSYTANTMQAFLILTVIPSFLISFHTMRRKSRCCYKLLWPALRGIYHGSIFHMAKNMPYISMIWPIKIYFARYRTQHVIPPCVPQRQCFSMYMKRCVRDQWYLCMVWITSLAPEH